MDMDMDMDTATKRRAIDDPRLQGFILTRGSENDPPRFARTDEPHEFTCIACGQGYESVWVGRHTMRPMCPRCITAARSGMGANGRARPDYTMPAIYAQDGSSILPEVAEWVHGPSHALVLTGGPGRGKSCQAHHAAAEATTRGLRSIIIGDRDLCMPDRADVALWVSVGLLVIDEVGKRTSSSALANLCDVLDARVMDGRKTIMVTNLRGDEMQALDARLSSRCRAAVALPFTGRDLRGPDPKDPAH